MRTLVWSLSVLLLALTHPGSSEAGTKFFASVLNAGQEVPPVASPATGNLLASFDTSTKQLCYSLSYVALVGNETASHFHGPAGVGVDGPILFDVSPNPPGPSPLGSGKQGCVGPFDKTAEKALKKGQVYINVHSDFETGGEIRGQLFPVKLKP